MKKKGKLKKFTTEEKRAKAVIPTQGELDIIIDQKIMDKVQRQKDFVGIVLDRIFIGREMQEFENQLTSKDIKVKWFGMPCPERILGAYFLRWKQKYKKMISHENYLKQALKNDGLTEKQIESMAMEGKLITDRKFLLSAERKAEKRRLKKQGKRGKQQKSNYFG